VKAIAVIPARYESSRFPGKVLAPLGPRPMIQWVYEAAMNCGDLDEVVVATDSKLISRCVEGFGGNVEATRSDHRTGTDRVAEVAVRRPAADVIVNVQADQPFVTPAMISALLAPYGDLDETPPMTTLACPLAAGGHDDPGTVKVVCDRRGDALYFSRAPIPHVNAGGPSRSALHHLGLYAFTRTFLDVYAALPAGPLELSESLEQLRALENGHRIRVCVVDAPVLEVNTLQDMERARESVARLS
jgi:3-deoxy-manno-octulosonate cytidylyltransferase (CMP-KDO synthetase)